MNLQTRRSFLTSVLRASAFGGLATFNRLSAAERGKVKITDIKTMMLKGPRTYTLVKIETDAGVHGIAEAYGSPGLGVREAIDYLRGLFIGRDPLQIDRLYTQFNYTDGSAHAQQRAMSGIEMALWDLAGKLLNVPTHALLGGKFRDRVRVYDHAAPKDYNDKISCRDWAQAVKAKPNGISAHKFSPVRSKPGADPGKDPSNRQLTTYELRKLREGYENCRDALGFEHDIMVHCHWEYDLRTSIDFAKAVEGIKPLWLEDPLPVAYSDSWRRLAEMAAVPICTGENWMRRADALPFVVNSAIDILHTDLRNAGGFLENKRLADLGDLYGLPIASHNTGSIVNGMATIHWASTVQDYLGCETVFFDGGWMDDVIVHDKPLCRNGHVEVPNGPGLGITLNPDVVKAHLAPGETWWG
ncbi:MAG: mandelate racemase/muconate lactonizing enzyme family protein [Opitutus sp.]|nr:mandelate racemase/muconate lactonizing enzyme family protein [Opitutus sp.]